MQECPLSLDEWIQFNEYKWGLKADKLRISIDNSRVPSVEAIVYLNKQGRIIMPRLNPYLPILFNHSPTNKIYRIRRQWLEVSGLLADEFLKRRIHGAVSFQPDITDMREFQWKGFYVEPRYTFYLYLPLNVGDLDHMVRKQINKSLNSEFQIHRTICFEKVIECLAETEKRQKFVYDLTVNDLREANRLVGEEKFRCYIAVAANGEVASSRIILKGSGTHAIDWVAGTKKKFLNSGVTQHLISFILDDLAKDGVKVFDFGGANLPTVQTAKSSWGGELKTYYMIRIPSIRTVGSISFQVLKNFFVWHIRNSKRWSREVIIW